MESLSFVAGFIIFYIMGVIAMAVIWGAIASALTMNGRQWLLAFSGSQLLWATLLLFILVEAGR